MVRLNKVTLVGSLSEPLSEATQVPSQHTTILFEIEETIVNGAKSKWLSRQICGKSHGHMSIYIEEKLHVCFSFPAVPFSFWVGQLP